MRVLAVLHLIAAAGIALFWVGFYTELTFPRAELAQKIPHFEAYYAFEKSFTIPDLTTALVMVIAAIALLRDPTNPRARTLLVAASGAITFLAMLDTIYDLQNGLYSLGPFSLELMTVPLIGILGVATIVVGIVGPSER